METKVCTKCSKELPATKEFFYAEKRGKYGVRSSCKKCDAKYHAKYYASDKYKESIAKSNAKYLASELL